MRRHQCGPTPFGMAAKLETLGNMLMAWLGGLIPVDCWPHSDLDSVRLNAEKGSRKRASLVATSQLSQTKRKRKIFVPLREGDMDKGRPVQRKRVCGSSHGHIKWPTGRLSGGRKMQMRLGTIVGGQKRSFLSTASPSSWPPARAKLLPNWAQTCPSGGHNGSAHSGSRLFLTLTQQQQQQQRRQCFKGPTLSLGKARLGES